MCFIFKYTYFLISFWIYNQYNIKGNRVSQIHQYFSFPASDPCPKASILIPDRPGTLLKSPKFGWWVFLSIIKSKYKQMEAMCFRAFMLQCQSEYIFPNNPLSSIVFFSDSWIISFSCTHITSVSPFVLDFFFFKERNWKILTPEIWILLLLLVLQNALSYSW